MLAVELIIVLLATFLGARLGRIGIGLANGLGVLVLAAIGVRPGDIPLNVISIIMTVITVISVAQVAGGLDYLVHQTEKLLRRNPEHITTLAPIATYLLTISAGTGNVSLAMLSVIAEIAKKQGVKPYRPLSTTVVSAQIAITAPSISAVVIYMSPVTEGYGISYLHLLSAIILSTLLVVLVMFFPVIMLFSSKPPDDPIYHKRLERSLVELRDEKQIKIKSGAETSVWLFLLGVVGVVTYAIINSPSVDLIEKPLMNATNTILIIMLSVATLATVIYKVDTNNILNSGIFKAGMSACICILDVAWLDDTFVPNNIDWIRDAASGVIQGHPWLSAVIFFFASALPYSQITTARALMPTALASNVSSLTAVASSAVVFGPFILPTYPTLVAAVQMDDADTTRIDKSTFNHPLFILGTLGVALAACFGFVLSSFMLQ